MLTGRELLKFWKLPPSEQRVLIAAAVIWLPGAWLGLRVAGLDWLQRRMRGGANLPNPLVSSQAVDRLATLVEIAAKYTLSPSTCLTRSMALLWLLSSHGLQGHLRIGVRITRGKLEAHAWVEYRGRAVNDPQRKASQFAPFAEVLPLHAFSS